MTLRNLPVVSDIRPRNDMRGTISPLALERWDATLKPKAAATEEDRSISIMDVVGYDFWTGEGVTAKKVAGLLRYLGKGPILVNINSPGGDVFEGLAIYNLLREHDGEVTVKVLGLAASIASVIAMGADRLEIARAGFFMVHNAWTVIAGNRHDFIDAAKTLEPFDRTIADVYASRSGMDEKKVAKMMDAETWIGGAEAVENGFADSLLATDEVEKGDEKERKNAAAVRRIESALRASGMPLSEAKKLISAFKDSARDDAARGERDDTDPGREAEEAASMAAIAVALGNITIPR